MNTKFRKKPVVIEAFQMTKERRTNADWPNWMHRAWQLGRFAPGSLYPTEEGTVDGTLSIGTLGGQHRVSFGDWIIQGIKGELYPCKPGIFELTYEACRGEAEVNMYLCIEVDGNALELYQTPTYITKMCLASNRYGKINKWRAVNAYIDYVKGTQNDAYGLDKVAKEERERVAKHITEVQNAVYTAEKVEVFMRGQ